ncbi:aminotransferase-like domain-containing protein [Lacticaseibacillus mingshuiensis]|uniref:PLP-dependent aminotransferase family protein n=1 Tax=Lacticaseibacillus mingshuiensis TaxID=2799574 RepID=A0ABW4CIX1_9LACO|nr:PLP-dependent aminotransferase family protein [Lacticaseibacillus mingshuiensis]
MQFATRVNKVMDSGLGALFAGAKENTISFAGGYPDPATFPQAAIDRAMRDELTARGDASLQYGGSSGAPDLRKWLAAQMTADGMPAAPDDILITQGAQQGIDLAARLFLEPGDGVVVEGPTYVGGLSAFDAYQPTYYEVPMTGDGMDLRALQKVLMQHSVKLIYTVPDFQNPTGVVMSEAKRRALVALANQYDVAIIEDSPYRWLRYSGAPIPPIKHFDTEGRVLFLGSFSKILAPGLRLGWLHAAPALMAALTALKGASDVESPHLNMNAVARYLTTNDFDQHLAQICDLYRKKTTAMADGLARSLPACVHFDRPTGGFFLWLTFPEGFDAEAFMADHSLPDAHVAFVPSRILYASHQVKNAARLNFTSSTLAEIEAGTQALGAALTEALDATAKAASH